MTLKVTILGCGGSAGVPSLGGPDGAGDWGACDPTEPRNRRSRASIVLHGPAGNVLVDTGPDMRAQILANRVPRIDSIIYTHAHADHILGFDDVRLLNRVINRPIPTFLTQPTLTELSRRFDYAFKRVWEPPMFLWPVVIPTIIEAGQGIHAGGLHIDTFEQDHEVTKTLGLRVEKFAYSTDVIRFSDEAWSSLAGIDTWLVGCFQRTPHWTHAHLDLVLQWRTRLNIRRTVLTHMGYDMDWSWLQSNLPPDVEVAHDGLILHVT